MRGRDAVVLEHLQQLLVRHVGGCVEEVQHLQYNMHLEDVELMRMRWQNPEYSGHFKLKID